MDDFNNDYKDSQELMKNVSDIVKNLFYQVPELFNNKDLKIYSIEQFAKKNNNSNHAEIFKLMDTGAGIDYIIYSKKDKRMITLAWRIGKENKTNQKKYGVYNSFSLRLKRNYNGSVEDNCEIRKRQFAIKNGLLYPQWTAQLFIDPDTKTFLSLAIAKTTDIFEVYDKGLYRICNNTKHEEDKLVFFHDVHWEIMKEQGYQVYDWYSDKKYKLCKCAHQTQTEVA